MKQLIVLGFALGMSLEGATWEPFIAKLRRVTRVEHPVGARITETEEVYMRSSDGSLRHEVWKISNGRRSESPAVVDLTEAASKRWYRLFEQELRAEWMKSVSNDVEQYYREPETFRSARENYLGIPCAVTRVYFDSKESGRGCRAIGYGIPLRNRSEGRTPDGKGTIIMETTLVDFARNTEPPSEKMRVPESYRVIENADPPTCPTCPRGR